jgi:hypothetical protein
VVQIHMTELAAEDVELEAQPRIDKPLAQSVLGNSSFASHPSPPAEMTGWEEDRPQSGLISCIKSGVNLLHQTCKA